MRRWKKIVLGLVASFFTLTLFLFVIALIILNRSLPDYEGEKRVAGLNGDVEIFFDGHAIPMINASSDEDAAFAIGYLHAQERLFQMDLARRAGEGRLSEIFGSKTVPFDKMFRTIGIFEKVKQDFERLNPATKKILIAYSKGVNSYLTERAGSYPIEFDLLGYDPYPWKPEHSLVIVKLMGWELNISWWTDVAFSGLVQKLGAERAKELLPDFPENAPTIIPAGLKDLASITNDFMEVDKLFRAFTGFVGTHIGSNNWVVNGSKSELGKPVIANDPHLAFSAPGKWYFVIVRSPGWNAEGFTLPGLPGIVIGKNKKIAWAMTNVMADDADFYIEQLDSSGTKYFFNSQWRNLEIKYDSFAVKDSAYHVFKIRKNHRGPIISDIHPYGVLYEKGVTATLSMRWTGLEFSDEVYSNLLLNKAEGWKDFENALRHFTIPGQNFVYADDAGNIGYVCAVRLPVRNSASPSLVYDGTTDLYDWKGFVPYEVLPRLFNPTHNFIATANNKTVGNFKYHISNLWEPSSRIERITELIAPKKKLSIADHKKIQNDITSPYTRQVVPFILAAFDGVKIKDKNLALALDLLKNWNFELDAGSQVPSIYAHFIYHFLKNTLRDELGDELLKEYVFIANVPYRIILKMLAGNSSAFFDDTQTPVIESRDEIVRKSLVDAIAELERELGRDITHWQWGDIHTLTFRHFFAGQSGLLDKLINIGPFKIGGDGTTVFNTEYSFNKLFEAGADGKYSNILGPSMRYIFDFADPDTLYFVMPTGQSGHFFGDHYDDMTRMWFKGEYIKLPLNKEKFVASAKKRLVLKKN